MHKHGHLLFLRSGGSESQRSAVRGRGVLIYISQLVFLENTPSEMFKCYSFVSSKCIPPPPPVGTPHTYYTTLDQDKAG